MVVSSCAVSTAWLLPSWVIVAFTSSIVFLSPMAASPPSFPPALLIANPSPQGPPITSSTWTLVCGVVYRHRARLVAQGFPQRPYDSFQPEETYSEVVHKDSLRLFLSICAAENLRIYQCDVKAAFLQAPLSEKIYMRALPGYPSVTCDEEEVVLELSSAIYGTKQASTCFWTAMHAHLIKKGYKSNMGDLCIFKKILPSGNQCREESSSHR